MRNTGRIGPVCSTTAATGAANCAAGAPATVAGVAVASMAGGRITTNGLLNLAVAFENGAAAVGTLAGLGAFDFVLGLLAPFLDDFFLAGGINRLEVCLYTLIGVLRLPYTHPSPLQNATQHPNIPASQLRPSISPGGSLRGLGKS